MYVWELVCCRLRVDGWDVRHSSSEDPQGLTYRVHLRRPGATYEACGPTLTEAYAAAARLVRQSSGAPRHRGTPPPQFSRAAMAWA